MARREAQIFTIRDIIHALILLCVAALLNKLVKQISCLRGVTVLILLCWYVIATYIARLLLSLLAIISLDIAAVRHLLRLLYRLATLGSALTLRTKDARAWVVVSLAWCLSRSWRDLKDVLRFACHFLLE